MLLTQIEAFLTVAERRSVSEAAGVLYVTQPALTTRLKNLERELGVELFVRTPRGMRLTPAGRAFRSHAQRAVQSLAEGRELLRELREGHTGELLVGARTGDLDLRSPARPPPLPGCVPERAPDRPHRATPRRSSSRCCGSRCTSGSSASCRTARSTAARSTRTRSCWSSHPEHRFAERRLDRGARSSAASG